MKASLKDLEKEVWLRKRNNGDLKWTTRDGMEISIKDMSDTHLVNTILMLYRNEAEQEHIGDCDPLEWYD